MLEIMLQNKTVFLFDFRMNYALDMLLADVEIHPCIDF